jgi:hypothetical protein
MRLTYRNLGIALGAIFSAAILSAQATPDPTGHWEGTVTPESGQQIRVEFDLGRSADGKLKGTFNHPDQNIKGLPLSAVAIQGALVTIDLRLNGGGIFQADLAADNRSMSGVFASQFGPVPFTLTRKGDAHFDAPPKNPAIGKEFEGTWAGVLDIEGGFRLVLKMANQADGTSSAVMTSVNEGGLEIPAAITQQSTKLTLTLPMTGSTFAGDVNAAGSELVGIYTTPKGLALPLTLKKTK